MITVNNEQERNRLNRVVQNGKNEQGKEEDSPERRAERLKIGFRITI